MMHVHSVLDKDKDKDKAKNTKTMALTLAMEGQKLCLPELRTKDDDKKKEGDFIQLIFKLRENKIIFITSSHLAWEAASCHRSYLFWEEYHSAEKAFDVRVWWVPAKC